MNLKRRRRVRAVVAGLGILSLTLTSIVSASGATAHQVDRVPPGRAAALREAAAEFGVPGSVMLAVSYHETRWESHAGAPSVDGGFGLMHLTTAVPARGGHGKDAETTPTPADAGQHTLDRAAQLLGVDPNVLKHDDRQNARGGAAILAQYARELNGGALPASVSDWYDAVARYSGATDPAVARFFADDVFATIRGGAVATAADGETIRLAPLAGTRTPATATPGTTPPGHRDAECPARLRCAFVPAAYTQNSPDDPTDYGNYDLADRPSDLSIRYIVIHDTEGSYDSAINTFQDPLAYVSAHYVIRSSDGAVTQMVRTRNVAWHAGNWWLNTHSIGIEHEGVAVDGATWYTEAMYRSSAALVRYLAARYHIPLDRQHIIGHDDVPGPTPFYVPRMHWDPGPFWDWSHYMRLLHAPVEASRRPGGGVVTIAPRFATNRPVVTDCASGACVRLPAQGASFVYLHTEPRESAPLLADPFIRGGAPGSTQADDWADKAASGQQFVKAGREGDWLGVYFAGTVGWIFDPPGARVASPTCGRYVTPAAGRTSIPVYGRAYPEAAAYPGTSVTPQPVVPLGYTIPAGQKYVTTGKSDTGYYSAKTYNGPTTLVVGQDVYYQISYNHRLAYVRGADVTTSMAC